MHVRAPLNPWTGSMSTAAIVSSIAPSRAVMSLSGTLRERGTPARRAPASYFAPSVQARVAAVRPCQPPRSETTPCRPVFRRASINWFSLASAPELQKKTRASGSGARRTSSAASRSRLACGTAVE